MGEGKIRANVQAELVRRGSRCEGEPYFDGEVRGAWIAADGAKLVRVLYLLPGGFALKTLNLRDYFITWIRYTSPEFPETMEEPYVTTENDQKNAFETLRAIFEEEAEIETSSEKETAAVSSLQGPKRIEVTLQQIGRSDRKRLVVTDVLAPNGHWTCYSIAGRVWNTYPQKLQNYIDTYWSTSHYILRVDAYLGGGQGSCTSHFSINEPKKAWAELLRMFSKFHQSEIYAIKRWVVDGKDSAATGDSPEDDDDDDLYSCGYQAWQGGAHHRAQHSGHHWTNQTPARYEPVKASYRVAGDEIGAELVREQRKVWDKENPGKTPEQVLQEIIGGQDEKKDNAGDESASGEKPGSRTNVQSFGGRCSQCGGLSCFPGRCLQEYDLAAYAGLHAGEEPTIH